ncbi:MAG: hypothetical protein IKT07_05165 [Oscillospiraceae bacterium]|nr:hypothetical protein [Oscillospiraceae bacterium]
MILKKAFACQKADLEIAQPAVATGFFGLIIPSKGIGRKLFSRKSRGEACTAAGSGIK